MAGLARLRILPKLVNNITIAANKQSLCRTVTNSSTQKSSSSGNSESKSTPNPAVYRDPVHDYYTSSNPKNWICYGYDETSKKLDRHGMHLSFFCAISILIMTGGYVLTYLPDFKHYDWSHREGYLELRRREKEGLPLIDPNFIDPSKFTLPSDEELGDFEIVI